MYKELAKSEKLKSRIEAVLAEFDKTDKKKINQTDLDCANMQAFKASMQAIVCKV